jgi:hypothetical protein
LSVLGATNVANLAVTELKNKVPDLAPFIKDKE